MADDRSEPQYKLRFSADLRDKIAAAADANKRSMNAEIIARLESTISTSAEDDDIALIFRHNDQYLDLAKKYSELQADHKRLIDLFDREKLLQNDDLAIRSREAASAAMTLTLHGYLAAARAAETKDTDSLLILLRPIMDALDAAIRSDDPYNSLRSLRNALVHHEVIRGDMIAFRERKSPQK